MRELKFHLIDVFTNQAFGGNQLAVFTDGRGLSTETMQQIAKEMNFSETTFVLPPNDLDNHYRVRIFTPASEMPMAGHPTVGTSFILAREQMIDTSASHSTIRLEEIVGVIPVELEFTQGTPTFITMQQPLPKFGTVFEDKQAIAEMLSLTLDDIESDYPIQAVSCGVPFLFVPLKTLRAVEHVKLRIDIWERILKDFEASKVFVFTHAAVTPHGTVHSRMFAPSLGIKEDAATGGASGPLGAYLVQHNIIRDNPAKIVSEQGFEMGRPSFIHIGIERTGSEFTRVTVGGQCVYMGSGVLQS